MSKSTAYIALDELQNSLALNKEFSSKKLETVLERYFILSLYTIWETYAKSKVFDAYSDYEYLLHTDEFIRRYLKKSFGKTYLSKEFLKDIRDTQVKKNILCQSNNLNWSEFIDLLIILDIDINILEKRIDESNSINQIVDILKYTGLHPVSMGFSRRVVDAVKGYLKLIVDLRNTISHTYKMEIDQKLNNKQMILLISLFKCIMTVIDEHIYNDIKLKYLNYDDKKKTFKINNVIKGCNASGNQNAILEVEVLDELINPFKGQLVIRSDDNIGYCSIKQIKQANIGLKHIPTNDKPFTLLINSSIKIKKSKSYEILEGLRLSNGKRNIINIR